MLDFPQHYLHSTHKETKERKQQRKIFCWYDVEFHNKMVFWGYLT